MTKEDNSRTMATSRRYLFTKGKNSESLGQFRPILPLNIDGKMLFGIIGKRIIDYASKNGHGYGWI